MLFLTSSQINQIVMAEVLTGNKAREEGMRDLAAYLESEKFWKDTTVQVKDVLTRLHEIQDAVFNAEMDKRNELFRYFAVVQVKKYLKRKYPSLVFENVRWDEDYGSVWAEEVTVKGKKDWEFFVQWGK